MATVSSGQRDAYGEERRNSDISLSSDMRPVLPTYEQSTDPNSNKENLQPVPLLSTRAAILLYVAIYTAVAVSGWAIVCQAAFKPIYRIPYVFGPGALRAAKVLTSIAGLLTIPMTSAACAYAAANYTQFSPRRRNGLSLRQSLALANNGWADPKMLLSLSSSWHARRQGSLLLWFAIVLNVIGALVIRCLLAFSSLRWLCELMKERLRCLPSSTASCRSRDSDGAANRENYSGSRYTGSI